MKARRATQILTKLIQGEDPISGHQLPASPPYNNAEVLRALLLATEALRKLQVGEDRKASLPANVGRTWSVEENAQLLEEFRAGETPTEIARKHGRTLRAIEARLEKLGLITASERTTRDRFETPPDA